MTPTDFLLARIADQEQIARGRPSWALIHASGCYYYSNTLEAGWYCDCSDFADNPSAFLVAECAAKRQIITACIAILAGTYDDDNAPDLAGLALQLLALPYADHPDYDEAWQPS